MKAFIRFSLIIVISTLLFVSPTAVHAAGTVITVNTTSDTVADDGFCSLREAIAAAAFNTDRIESGSVTVCPAGSPSEPDTIAFDLGGGGPQTISVTSFLGYINSPVIIDGTTQPGYSGTPLVRIDGGDLVGYGLAFEESSDGSTMKGVMVTRFQFGQISLFNSDNTSFVGNYIGTDGSNDLGGNSGIIVSGSSNIKIGGPAATDRNVIAGNLTDIQLFSETNGASVQGNFIGLFADGSTSPSGSGTGIAISITSSPGSGAPNNTIGGLGAGEGNVIAGHSIQEIGVYSDGQSFSDGNIIRGNIIGLQAGGTAAPSVISGDGIKIVNSDSTLIEGNVISGKNASGIDVEHNPSWGQGSASAPDATVIRSNKIGTDLPGSSALGNGTGIFLYEATNSVIGGNGTLSQRNLVSGNQYGIEVNGGSGNIVDTNVVGMNASYDASLANTSYGIHILDTAVQMTRNWVANSPTGISFTGTGTTSAPYGNNCVTGNSTSGLDNATGSALSFTNNWWGNASGPSGSGPGTGDAVSSNVDFSSFLTSPAAICSAQVSLSSSSFNFGNWMVGANSSLHAFTLTNTGNLTLHLTSITTAIPFSLVSGAGTCPTGAGTLASGASCTIQVKFSPSVAGSASGSVTITSGAASSPDVITLSGTGVKQLLKNTSFEIDANNDKKPDYWTFTNFNLATDKRDCAVRKSGTCSLKFVGNNSQKMASQTIIRSGVAGDVFNYSLWSRSSNVPVGSIYRVQVLFYNGNTLLATRTKNFNTGTHTFEQVSGSYTAPGPYTKVVYRIVYKAASSSAWFDVASLTWNP